MEQYIKKSTIVEEINRVLNSYDPNEITSGRYALISLRDFLDNLEVKEVNLENSIVCRAGWCDGFFLNYSQEQQDTLLEKIGVDVGDKVRVILMKE